MSDAGLSATEAGPASLGGPERVQRAIAVMERYGGTVPGFRRAHGRGTS